MELSLRRPVFNWWRGKDSNLRRQSRQIYSLIPLAAREPLRTKPNIMAISSICVKQLGELFAWPRTGVRRASEFVTMGPRIAPSMPLSFPVLRTVLNPRSAAVGGASESPRKFGGRFMNFLVKHGFKGSILPINPNSSTILGFPAYPRTDEAPGPIDVALLAVSGAQISAAIAACDKAQAAVQGQMSRREPR
jgi:hypothetical protein